MRYLEDPARFSWTLSGLARIQRRLGIRVVAGMVIDRDEVAKAYDQSGLTNVGPLNKTEFYKHLAHSSVLVGVGQPRISPSPWDALCMGVPVGRQSVLMCILKLMGSSSTRYWSGMPKSRRIERNGTLNNGT